MYNFSRYLEPLRVADALELAHKETNPVLIAGGTDLLIKMRESRQADTTLISLSKINDLKTIYKQKDGSIRIGSMATFSQIMGNTIINEEIPILAVAAKSLAGPQIRNVATIGGNICNGAPSADSAPSLLALNGQLEFASLNGIRIISINDFYLGPYKTSKRPDEILTSIIIRPLDRYFGGHYIKFSRRKAMDISTLGCAVTCALNDDGTTIKYSRIALGTAAPTPIRCVEAEKISRNKTLSNNLLKEIGEAALKEANPRTSWRATKEFRQALVEELVPRALRVAYEQARG
ncbi:MAG: hypothetical protein APF76_14110 [Desulfitibacter sp. BRH_c19]|nr:MAG: hypothetical protein APF76_14110 [Desulfitibacter sp. BRH_c19]